MKLLQRSLTARLLTLVLLLAIIPLVGVGLLSYDRGRNSIVNNVEAQLESVTTFKRQEIQNWIDHLEHAIEWVASSPLTTSHAASLATYAVDDPEYLATHDALVSELRRITNLDDFILVFIADSNSGRILASSDESWEGQFRETEPWFVQGKTNIAVSSILHNIALGRPTMVVAAPVTDGDGQLLGVLGGHANLERLNEIMLERSGLGESGETYLVNKGNLLLTESRFEPGVAFKKWIFTDGVSQALAGESGVDHYQDYRNEPVIGAYRWLDEREMVLLAEIDQTEAFAPIVTLSNEIIRAGAIVAVIAAAIALLVTRTITGPLQELVIGTEEIGQGNLGYQIKIDAKDEIGQLALAFNEMTSNLLQSIGEVAHGQSLLEALSQAAQAVQQARTSLEVHETVGIELEKLGFHSIALDLVNGGESLSISHLSFASDVITALKKLTGLDPLGYTFPIEMSAEFKRMFESGETVYFDEAHEKITESLPRGFRHLTGRIASLFGIEQSVVAPLFILGKAHGLLFVTGKGLTEADVPAVNAFANQTAIALENARLHQEEIAWAAELEQRVEDRSAELVQSEERFRSAFDLAAIGRALATPDGRFQRVNNVMCEITGYTREELLTKAWPELTPPDYMEASMQNIEMLMKGEISSYQLEQQALHKDGHGVWILLNVVLARDTQGNPLLMIGDIQDISERKAVEERNRLLNEELEERVRQRTEDLQDAVEELQSFSYSVSHDLRAPLRAMDGFARILNEDYSSQLPNKGQRYLEKVRESAQKMGTLIDDLLAFSRLGRSDIKVQSVEPGNIVRKALEDLQFELEDRQVEITIGELRQCHADPVLLKQVFVNFLQNAIKFTRGCEAAEIEVSSYEDGKVQGERVYYIRDNGVGFDMQYAHKLFGVFQRLHRAEDYEGTGVGLATVQRIIRRHGGRVWAEGEVDKGATFYFTLPNGEVFGTGQKTEGIAIEFPG